MDLAINISYHKKLYLMVLTFIWVITISFIILFSDILFSDWVSFLIIITISVFASIIAFFDCRRLVDIISRKQKKEKNRIRKELTDNINHELKTPVASIQVCLETLLSGIDLTEEKRQELIGR